MNHSTGAATQICSAVFDRKFLALPSDIQQRIQSKIDSMGRRLATFSHYRMENADTFRLRIGDYRVIYPPSNARPSTRHL